MDNETSKSASLDGIAAAVDRNFDKQTEWLSQLVRFRSVRGQEQPCQAWLAREFRARGWEVDRFTVVDVEIKSLPGYSPTVDADEADLIQLIASVPQAGPALGKSLILQGHVDVVPEGPHEMWARAPFSGDVADGWLHGRGAQDMKMGISAMVFALDAIDAAGYAPASPVYVQTVTEEESTGNGALAVLARGCRADACLIPEPTANTITRAQTGAIWFRLRVRGQPVHVARAQTGSNAILSTYGLISALADMTASMNAQAKTDTWFGGTPDPIKFNVGRIKGGDWPSSTPAWCELDCRIGALPGQSLAELRQQVQDTVLAASANDPFLAGAPPEIIWNGFQAEGAALLPRGAAEASLAAAHRTVFGQDMQERRSTAVNDTRYHNLYYGIPGLCYGPAGKGMHGLNERANLASLRQTTLVFARFIAGWCGLRAK